MKRFKLIGLGLTILIVLAILHFNFGLFNRFNFITAYWDKWTGNERIIIYGEPFETDSLKTALAPKFGFQYERQGDCTVTKPFVNGVEDYNEIMGQEITERLGGNWDKILDEEISKTK
jgi:hypothetical protein